MIRIPRSLETRALAIAVCGLALLTSPQVGAQESEESVEADAATVIDAMSSYLAGLQGFTAQYDVDVDIITYDGEKRKFSSSGELFVRRPDKLYLTRRGVFADTELFLDGQALTIYGKYLNSYLEMPATTIDEAIKSIRDNTGFDAPGADLLGSKPLDLAATDVVSGVHVGMAFVDGAEVHHLAFRGEEVDWQLWVQAGDQPLPLKYVITSKWQTGAPEYALRLSNWNTAPEIDAARFTFNPPAQATKLESVEVDEIGQFRNMAEGEQ